jgi:hypothetical protein
MDRNRITREVQGLSEETKFGNIYKRNKERMNTDTTVWAQRLQEKSFAPAGDQTPVAQSVVRHYTD